MVANSLFITGNRKEDSADLDQEPEAGRRDGLEDCWKGYIHIEDIYIEKVYKSC